MDLKNPPYLHVSDKKRRQREVYAYLVACQNASRGDFQALTHSVASQLGVSYATAWNAVRFAEKQVFGGDIPLLESEKENLDFWTKKPS